MKKHLTDKEKKYRFFRQNYPLRVIVGMLVFFLLMLLNCFEFFCGAEEKSKELIVVIDAGHGGNDPGKVSADGIMEKDINLEIALKLKDEFENNGVKVILTRDCDKCLAETGATNKKKSDMINRMEIVNDSGAALLISIHQNSYKDSKVRGAQVFYYGSSKESKKYAEDIQHMINKEADNENNRLAKSENSYYVLRKSSCPAVIIECGFLSNPDDTLKLTDEKYQQRLAAAIVKAVVGKN